MDTEVAMQATLAYLQSRSLKESCVVAQKVEHLGTMELSIEVDWHTEFD